MKTIAIGLLCLGFVQSTCALDKVELDSRIQALTGKLEALQQKPDRSIPAEQLQKAQGIILLDRTKAGFIFAYQGGSGAALVKDAKSEKWGPVGFVTANEASLGFQIGGEQNFIVILLMNTNVTRMLTENNFDFGGEARGTAPDVSSGVEGKVSPTPPSVQVYTDRTGLYGGAAIKGGAIAPDETANRTYYGEALTMNQILFEKKVQPTEKATALAGKLSELSKPKKK